MFEQISKFANEAGTTVTDAMNDTDITERFTTTSDQVLDAVLDTNRRVVDFAVTTADRVNEQINLDVPFADSFPTPTEAGERYLDFVERAVSLNRDMNQRVVEMINADHAKNVTDTAKNVAETANKTAQSVSDTATKTARTVADTATKTAKSVTPAKQTAAKKRPATKSTAKKRPAKKATAKKTTAKKSTAKKSTAKKATASK